MKRICVFCGSKVGDRPIYTESARCLAEILVERGLGLVFGGGHIGLMGVLADTMLAHGGEVVGVIPRALRDKELAHTGVQQMHIVESMHERKALMADLSDGFIALPGGFGTADEFFEILTWKQLKIHHKPTGILNTSGYFDFMLRWLDHMVAEGFVRETYRQMIIEAAEPRELVARMGVGST